MNIAICISGNKRTFDKLKQNIENNLINDSNIIFAVLDEQVDLDIDRALYFQEQKLFTDYIDKFNNQKRPETPVNNVLQMFYRIYKCGQLKKEYENEKNIKFDIVVRLRPDLEFLNKVDFKFLNDNEIAIPSEYNFGGICDQFFYSNSFHAFSRTFCAFSSSFISFSKRFSRFSNAFKPFSNSFCAFSSSFYNFSKTFYAFSNSFASFSRRFSRFSNSFISFSSSFSAFSNSFYTFRNFKHLILKKNIQNLFLTLLFIFLHHYGKTRRFI